MSNEKLDIVLEHDKVTKGSNRWAAMESNQAVPTIYIRKPHFQGVKRIRVTVEEVQYTDEPMGDV
jgi:hypothetical protein